MVEGRDIEIEVDGGITPRRRRRAVKAGANVACRRVGGVRRRPDLCGEHQGAAGPRRRASRYDAMSEKNWTAIDEYFTRKLGASEAVLEAALAASDPSACQS